ncbi:MAG: NADP-dependent oxidoreductase [Deltaproteobacteria bacterium]|nr:MAG: NADP-dependent oxidoreductase [Deltaproteobacteria bacterium]
MKAAIIRSYGAPNVFQVEEFSRPSVGPRDVLIEVHASSVNPVDWKIRSGGQRGAIRYKLPWVLGMDVSGVVAEVGSSVTKFKPGDEVYSSPTHRRSGTYAEWVAIDEDAVALKPKNISHYEAASIPLVGLTAWESLVVKGNLQPGQKVLIQAGSGGVGSIAIQLAKHLGAYVITTCSGRNIELVKSLGADQVIDYTQENFDEVLSDIDLAVDALGGESMFKARKVLKRGGRLAMLRAALPENTKRFGPNLGLLITGWQLVTFILSSRLLYGIKASSILRQCSGEFLNQLTNLIEAGQIKPLVDKVFPLDEIAEAHKYSETGRARGKIVIAVKPE